MRFVFTFSSLQTRFPSQLLQLKLPEFTGKETLDRFAEQLTNILISSGIDTSHWLTYLKQPNVAVILAPSTLFASSYPKTSLLSLPELLQIIWNILRAVYTT